MIFCRPCQGLDGFGNHTHGFTVGYYLSRLRRFICRCFSANLFPDGEGLFKRVVVLPVGEIGEVIFAHGFRQSFAGDGSWIFPRAFLCPLDADALNNENNSSAPKNNCHNAAKQQ